MKNRSLKTKLTLLYTVLMTLVILTALAVLLSLSGQALRSGVQTALREQVHQSTRDITPFEDRLEIDSDFYDLDQGIYLSVYGEDGTFLYGRVPYGFNTGEFLRDGQLRTLSSSETQWYVYDARFDLQPYGEVYIRGVSSVAAADHSTAVTFRFAGILLPLMAAVTAFIGYRMTRRALLPVRRITETVQKIQTDEDLSRRVGLGSGRDEIYRLGKTFDGLLEKLEASFQREKQFTSDVSHELRTPLTVILNQCGAMLEHPDLSRTEREGLLLIQKKASDMARLISQLLLLSRADQGRQPVNPELLSLSELTEITAEEQQALAAEKDITLETRIQPGIMAAVDETLYIRMLTNLISNAVSYGRKGGHIYVSLDLENGMAVGRVRDDGYGISEKDLPHIFERFYRGDSSRTDSSHSGLGLSMAQWILKVHSGFIDAESTPTKGSVFTFRLPAASEDRSPKKT